MKNIRLKAFTIAEVLLSLVIMGAIGMLLMPTLVSTTSNEALYTSLSKTYADMKQVIPAVSMLQISGRIAPGEVTPDKFMQALVLTHKCFDLTSTGTLIAANSKYTSYIYPNDKLPNNTNVDYGEASYNIVNRAGVNRAGVNTTVILKNHVIVSLANDGDTIVVDVNGRKAPNMTGRDIYFFVINNGTLQAPNTNCNLSTDVNSSGGCANKYLRAGKIN